MKSPDNYLGSSVSQLGATLFFILAAGGVNGDTDNVKKDVHDQATALTDLADTGTKIKSAVETVTIDLKGAGDMYRAIGENQLSADTYLEAGLYREAAHMYDIIVDNTSAYKALLLRTDELKLKPNSSHIEIAATYLKALEVLLRITDGSISANFDMLVSLIDEELCVIEKTSGKYRRPADYSVPSAETEDDEEYVDVDNTGDQKDKLHVSEKQNFLNWLGKALGIDPNTKISDDEFVGKISGSSYAVLETMRTRILRNDELYGRYYHLLTLAMAKLSEEIFNEACIQKNPCIIIATLDDAIVEYYSLFGRDEKYKQHTRELLFKGLEVLTSFDGSKFEYPELYDPLRLTIQLLNSLELSSEELKEVKDKLSEIEKIFRMGGNLEVSAQMSSRLKDDPKFLAGIWQYKYLMQRFAFGAFPRYPDNQPPYCSGVDSELCAYPYVEHVTTPYFAQEREY